jgi:hypothetical protein
MLAPYIDITASPSPYSFNQYIKLVDNQYDIKRNLGTIHHMPGSLQRHIVPFATTLTSEASA